MRLNYRGKREIMHKYMFEDIDEIDKKIKRLEEEAQRSKNEKRVNEIIKELAELNTEKERRQIDFEKGYYYENEEERNTGIENEMENEKETVEEIQNEISRRIRRLNQLEIELGTVENFKQRKEILEQEKKEIEKFNELMNRIWKNEEI